jgi:hypothetical protein
MQTTATLAADIGLSELAALVSGLSPHDLKRLLAFARALEDAERGDNFLQAYEAHCGELGVEPDPSVLAGEFAPCAS